MSRRTSLTPGSRRQSLPFLSTITEQSRSIDDWAFADRGLPPEQEPTKEVDAARDPSPSPTMRNGVSEGEDDGFENFKPNIYQTHAGRRRAKVPDKEVEPAAAAGTQASAPAPLLQPNGTANGQVGPEGQKSKAETQKILPKAKEETILRHMMLHWRKADVRGLKKTVLDGKVQQANVNSRIESQNNVLWQHSRLESITLKRVEEIVYEAKAQGVQDSEFGLTRRLLRRVRTESERHFVEGRFLAPRALRYDSLDSSKYSSDKCCIFLAFPYFEVMKERAKTVPLMDTEEHTVRTLLQSLYRLSDTTERDNTQSIRMLTQKSLSSCIQAEDGDAKLSKETREYLIYVPQLWAIILGLDRLMTIGSISDRSLQGRTLEVETTSHGESRKRCSLVRICFKNKRRKEVLTYPIEQCRSWFGLLNKQQQIRGVLAKDRMSQDSSLYKIKFNDHVIRARTWALVQKLAQNEVLELEMETPERPFRKPKAAISNAPSISVQTPTPVEPIGSGERVNTSQTAVTENGPGGSSVPAAMPRELQDQQSTSDADDENIGTFHPPIEGIKEVKIVLAILQWRVFDDTRDEDHLPTPEEVNRFVDLIYRNLPAFVGDRTSGFSVSGSAVQGSDSNLVVAAGGKPSIKARTREEIVVLLHQMATSKPREDVDSLRELLRLLREVWSTFLPIDYEPQNLLKRFFWGAAYEIVSRAGVQCC